MKKTLKEIITIIILIGIFFGSGLFIGCNTLKVFNHNKVISCNDYYSALDAELKSGSKSSVASTLWLKECQADRVKRYNKDCIQWINDGKKIDKKDYKKKLYLEQCEK